MSTTLPEGTGTCTSFNWKGFGFIDMAGTTLFVHQAECEAGKVPKVGDVLTFQYEQRRQNPEQFQAKNVKGCTGIAQPAWGQPFTGPVDGTGAHTGTVKSFGPKGYGFINMEDGKEMFFNVRDCVGSKPIAGDTVKFDVADSDTKPGQLKATNITGGSQSLDTPHPGTKPSWDSWGGMGDMGAALGAMAAMFSSMGGKGWASGGKGWGGKGGGKQWGGDGGSWSSSGKGGSYGPQSGSAPVPPGPYSPGGCAKGGW